MESKCHRSIFTHMVEQQVNGKTVEDGLCERLHCVAAINE